MRNKFLIQIVMGILLSGCSGGGGSGGGVGGIADLVGPALPSNLVLSAISPSRIQTPSVSGVTAPNSIVEIYSGSNCTGALIGSGTSDGAGNFSVSTSTLVEGAYDLSVKVTNAQGASTCSGQSVNYVVDRTGPSVTLSNPTLALMGVGNWLKYTVTYSEPSTITLAPSDVALQTTGTANCSVVVNNVSTTVAEIVVSNCTGNGTVAVALTGAGATDAAGNTSASSGVSAAFSVDNTGISSGTFAPLLGDYSVLPTYAEIVFPEDIDPASVTAGDFSLAGSTCAGVSISSVSVVQTTVRVNFTGTLTCALMEEVVLTADLSGIADAAGNLGSGNVSGTYRLNNVGPTSVAFNPSLAAVNPIPTTVSLTFGANIDAATVSAADFPLSGTCPGVSISNISVSGAVATVTLNGTNSCAHGQTVIFGVDLTGINDLMGNAGIGSYSQTWARDAQGPSGSFALSSSTLASLPSSLTITLDPDTDLSSVSASDFILAGTCSGVNISSIVKTSNIVTINLGGTTACHHNEAINFGVNFSGITDSAGNSGSGSSSVTFTLDSLGPQGVMTMSSASLAALPTSVTVTLSPDTNLATVSAADFALTGNCGASIGSVNAATNVVLISFLNVAGCTNGQTLTFSTNLATISDNLGNAGSGVMSATVTLDSVGPSGALTTASGTYNPLPSNISFTFDTDTDMASVSSGDFSLSGTCMGPAINNISKGAASAQLTLSGLGGCSNGSTVIVTLNLASVQDNVGNSGTGTVVGTYVLDNVGPVASMVTSSRRYNPLPTSFDVTVSADTNMSTVTTADFSLIGSSCGAVAISSISQAGQVVTVHLSNTNLCINNSTVVLTANMATMNDTVGNAGVGTTSATYTFDNVGPLAALSVSTNVYNPIPATVDVTYSVDTDMSTVTTADFLVLGTCGVTLGSVSSVGNVATLHLNGTAGCGTLSTVIITSLLTSVSDTAGNPGIGVVLVTLTKL